MNCPKCGPKKLEEFKSENIIFDFCSEGCFGMWTNQGELAYYTQFKEDLPWKKANETQKTKTKFNCPVCPSTALFEMPYHGTEPDPKVDFCEKCHGIWLDFKELGMIMKQTTNTRVKKAYDQLQDRKLKRIK